MLLSNKAISWSVCKYMEIIWGLGSHWMFLSFSKFKVEITMILLIRFLHCFLNRTSISLWTTVIMEFNSFTGHLVFKEKKEERSYSIQEHEQLQFQQKVSTLYSNHPHWKWWLMSRKKLLNASLVFCALFEYLVIWQILSILTLKTA